MSIAINIVIWLALAILIFRFVGREFPILFWSALFYRVAMGMALGLVYLHYYSANDTWLFFKDANALAQFALMDLNDYGQFIFFNELPTSVTDQLIYSQERSLFLVKIMSVFSLVGDQNYWISAAWFSLISFYASWYLFALVIKIFSQSMHAAAIAFLFFPSVVFWSSGLVKETLALAGIYFLAALFLKIIYLQKTHVALWLLAPISFWVAWNLKYYWMALFGAVMCTSILIHLSSTRVEFVSKHKLASWIILLVVLCGGVSLLHPNFYPSRFLEVLITNHNDFLKISNHGLVQFYNLHASWTSIAVNSPWALFSGLFRPFVWEATGMAALLASLENFAIVMLVIGSLKNFKWKGDHRLLLFSVCMYVALLCIFLTLSTPNLGTLSRYRIGFLPFLIFVLTYRNVWLEFFITKITFRKH